MKTKKNEFHDIFYVKCITTGGGFIGVLFFFYSIINTSLMGGAISMIVSIIYFLDKDMMLLFKEKPKNFIFTIFIFFIVGILLMMCFFRFNMSKELFVFLLGVLMLSKVFFLCKHIIKLRNVNK